MKNAVAIASLFLLACGSSAIQPSADMGPPGSYSLTFGPIDVASGAENTQCIVQRLGNANALHVGTIHNVLGTSSHHMIVYKVNDTLEQTTPFNCKPFTDALNPAKGSPLMITQKKDETLMLPAGVAFSLDANQMIRIEMHYINTTPATVSLQSTATFIPIADSAFQNEAEFLFIGDPDITLPPMTMQTVGPAFFQLPSQYVGVNFFAITGHEHQLGTNVTVSVATSKTDPGTPVYDVPNWVWSEPATVFANPPFQIAAGSGFKFTCTYNNTTANTVKFGESATNEMCFFWAYYYPSQGARVCFHTDQYPGGVDLCCPGSNLCSYFGG